jgi:CRISPR/Cas system-associated exonuclease Cas4 (RecB family)
MKEISKAIDPKRTGISKSLITSTALCNRKGWFSEHVRMDDGSRVPLIAPERVAFGAALDEAILFIVQAIRDDERWTLGDAHALGVKAALNRPHEEGIDWEKFANHLTVALELFAYDVLGMPDGQPLIDFRMSLLQGLDGDSIRVRTEAFGDVVGTPDFIIAGETRPNGRDLVLDLKSSARMKSEKDLRSAEMSFYAYLYAQKWGGDLPSVGYLTYVRTKTPRYQILVGEATGEHLRIAEEYLKTTKSVVARETQEEVGFTTSMCKSCEWRKANPTIGFAGCSVGLLVADGEEEE